jgi:hypothetical protein
MLQRGIVEDGGWNLLLTLRRDDVEQKEDDVKQGYLYSEPKIF